MLKAPGGPSDHKDESETGRRSLYDHHHHSGGVEGLRQDIHLDFRINQ